jgi:hypothetical protein
VEATVRLFPCATGTIRGLLTVTMSLVSTLRHVIPHWFAFRDRSGAAAVGARATGLS